MKYLQGSRVVKETALAREKKKERSISLAKPTNLSKELLAAKCAVGLIGSKRSKDGQYSYS